MVRARKIEDLGTHLARQGRTLEAGRLWDRALLTNPALEEAVLNLTQIRPPKDSRLLLQKYLEINPVSRKALSRLAELPPIPIIAPGFPQNFLI